MAHQTGDLITREEALALEYRHMTEGQFLQRVVNAARTWGWSLYHHDTRLHRGGVTVEYGTKDGPVTRRMRPRQLTGRGFPDCVLAKAGHQLVVAELKTQKGRLSPEQLHWGEVLASLPGVRYRVWRPRHMDEIEALLMEPEVAT